MDTRLIKIRKTYDVENLILWADERVRLRLQEMGIDYDIVLPAGGANAIAFWTTNDPGELQIMSVPFPLRKHLSTYAEYVRVKDYFKRADEAYRTYSGLVDWLSADYTPSHCTSIHQHKEDLVNEARAEVIRNMELVNKAKSKYIRDEGLEPEGPGVHTLSDILLDLWEDNRK